MTTKKMQGKREADPPEYVGGPWDGQEVEQLARDSRPAKITHVNFKASGWYVLKPTSGDYVWNPTP